MAGINWPDSLKETLLKSSREYSTNYIWFAAPKPIKQGDQRFAFIVLPVEVTPELELKQCGRGVLCQTEAEAKESMELLSKRDKEHIVAFQAAGFGGVGIITNFKHLIREQAISHSETRGKRVWLALERNIDKATGEITMIRRQEVANEQEALRLAKQWQQEYEREKKKSFDAMEKSVTPPPPSRAVQLTKNDMENLAEAKIIVLKRQWPRCFEIFERQKSNPDSKIPDQQIEDAYLLDLVENGGDLWLKTVEGGKVRADKKLISALHKAIEQYAKRGKGKIIDTAIYLIAFNWELGWCYLSDEQLAEKLCDILETPFTPGQVKQYRYRTLGLVAKHLPGPSPKST